MTTHAVLLRLVLWTILMSMGFYVGMTTEIQYHENVHKKICSVWGVSNDNITITYGNFGLNGTTSCSPDTKDSQSYESYRTAQTMAENVGYHTQALITSIFIAIYMFGDLIIALKDD